MAMVEPRDWQNRCKGVVTDSLLAQLAAEVSYPLIAGKIGACVGAGKSTMMAMLAHDLMFGDLAEICPVDFNVFVAPNKSITGSHGDAGCEPFGIIGALLEYNIWPLERVAIDRMPGIRTFPEPEISDAGIITGTAAVLTYHYLRQPKVVDTFLAWAAEGKKIAFHFDEIHHVPHEGTSWSRVLESLSKIAVLVSYFSGTWFRTDQREIRDQVVGGSSDLTFCYSYAEGIEDGIVRPVSFWIPDVMAKTFDHTSGQVVDERPVSEYLEEIPPHVKQEMFDPNGWFVENMIRRADYELSLRRKKYPDAGCLIVCPPGFNQEVACGEASQLDREDEDRIATIIHKRVQQFTGKRAVLVLNGTPVEEIARFRESKDEYIVAVNRISEGANIPRLRMGLCLRDLSKTELLFTQILGRIIRRRSEDDEEPALFIMPPINAMCEFARNVNIAKKNAVPKKAKLCSTCKSMPCICPCARCKQRRPCKCPCIRCLQRPCICKKLPDLNLFAELSGIQDSHIAHGSDIVDRFARRAGLIRDKVPECHHRDLANIAFLLQCDEEVNGPAPQKEIDPVANVALQVATAQNWTNLRDAVKLKVMKLQRFFRHEKNQFQAAWRHINKKFFQGTTWSAVSEDPSKLSFEKLTEINTYLDRTLRGGRL